MAAEDFSFFLQKVPGAMIFLGHFDEDTNNGAALHSPQFFLNEGILARGAAYHVALATEFLKLGGFPSGECSNVKAL
jgi:metal-dependent amidase/aminoacylase/carboxypeptidase family protein